AFGPSGEGYVRLALVQDEDAIRQAVDLVAASGILSGGKSKVGR
ncbi:LL-diaminopimelate aminotransferase, partial [Enterocloster lavalensis]